MQLASAASAADRVDPRRAQAERLVAEGRCTPALEVLAELRRADPNDARTLLQIAHCELDEQRYQAAAETLAIARSAHPNDGEIRLQLAIALYHVEDFAASSVELETAAQTLGEERAEIALYRGLLLLTQPEAKSAAAGAAWLERARALGGADVEPVASYYAGMGWSAAQDRGRAREALQRVVREWPGTNWATQAERRLEEMGADSRRWWGSLRAGLEYDSNAVLQGQGVPLPSEISSQRDIRGVWSAQAGTELFRTGQWAGGAALNYFGSAYRDVKSFDTQFPGVAVWLDRRLDDATTLRVAADGGYAWVAEEPFFWTQRASLSLLRQWTDAGSSELFARYWRDDYLKISGDVPGPAPGVPYPSCAPPAEPLAFCGPAGLDEHAARNRDGNGTTIGFLHSMRIPVELPFGDATARFGYQYDRFVARGTEYTYQAHAVAGGVRVGLPWSAALDVSGSWAYRPYRHPSTFPNQPLVANTEYVLPTTRHRETSYAVDIVLERPIATWLTASARWHLERTHSTVEVFDYQRQIVGAYLTATMGN
jgi:tetratricopeptide (TPR) repeat protein